MNNGWIKLWEETIYHPIWRDDPVAWRVFEYLLITSYRGTPQGTTVKTTQQIADACFGGAGKNGTCYKAIKRLEKHGMVKTKSTNKRTEFKIVNWWKYQGNRASGKNEVKTQQKHSNTLIKNKEIELRNISTNVDIGETPMFGKNEINILFGYWQVTTGIAITSRIKQNRNACNNLLKVHGLDGVKQLIRGVNKAQTTPYAPKISNFEELQEKLPKLMVWGKSITTKGVIKV